MLNFFKVRIIIAIYIIICCFLVSCSKIKRNKIPAPGTTLRNIPYGTANDTNGKKESLFMDIDLPAGANNMHKYPLMVFIHGGGFIEGDKRDMASYCSLFADSGFVCASLNYRLGWRNGKEKCDGDSSSEYFALYRAVQDANAALRFLIFKKRDYDIDTSRIFIGGGSAGSSIAMYTTFLSNNFAQKHLTNEYDSLGALNTSGNALTPTFTIKGILNMWGAVGDSTLITPFNVVPVISFHGTADASTPYDIGYEYGCTTLPQAFGSACISRQLAAYHVPYELHLKQGASHAPKAYKAPVVAPLAIRFFNAVMKGTASDFSVTE